MCIVLILTARGISVIVALFRVATRSLLSCSCSNAYTAGEGNVFDMAGASHPLHGEGHSSLASQLAMADVARGRLQRVKTLGLWPQMTPPPPQTPFQTPYKNKRGIILLLNQGIHIPI